ncbi:MAG: SPFH domain-containing protein [Caulobacterales bacterium]|nr:SPFH domain-containing protein [Caulobacterales bacterium]
MSDTGNRLKGISSSAPRVARIGLTVAVLAFVLVGGGCTVTACSTTVESGEAGIKTTRFGANPGVQPTELRPGWHWKGIGEEIIVYPTRQRTYSYTREANSDGKENEEIAFADQTGLPMTADVNLTIRVRDDRAAELYARWRQPFDDLLDGQIRNDVRSAIAKETEQVPVSCNLNTTPGAVVGAAPVAAAPCTGSLMGAGRQVVIQRAFQRVRSKWAAEGVEISQMEWVGTIRYPPSVTAAVEARTQTEQRTLAAQQKAAEARANAEAAIETARGIAESTRLRGEALRANPEIIQQIYAERSQGLCPPGTDTCIIGQGAWGLVPGRE